MSRAATKPATTPSGPELSDWRVLKDLTRGKHGEATWLFVLMLAAAVFETLGLSLVLPLMGSLIEPGSDAGFHGGMAHLQPILDLLPEQWRVVILLAAFAVLYGSKSVVGLVLAGLDAHFAMDLRRRWSVGLLDAYLAARYQVLARARHGEMLHNAITEPFRAGKAMIIGLNLLAKLLVACAIFLMLFLVDWQVTLGVAVVGGIIYFVSKNAALRYSVAFGKERLSLNQEIGAAGSEGLASLKELKVLGQAGRVRAACEGLLERFTRIQTRFAVFNKLPESFLELVVLALVALLVIWVHFSPGADRARFLSLLGFFVVVGQKLFTYVSFVIAQRMKFTSEMPSLRLIHRLLARSMPSEDLEQGEVFPGLTGDIHFEKVRFAYEPDRPVLESFDLTLKHNTMTALIGPSGAGKSTVADLLMRLVEPEAGRITAGGKDIAGYSLASWRGKVGYVGQEPHLFNLSVRENILLGKPEASQEEVERAAKLANIHEFIAGLPQGYDTVVGERGQGLSGGQRQRLVIARALVRDPDILIFDEATSALDTATEAEIQRAIEELAGSRTILVIAHRLSTIEKAHAVCDLGSMNHRPGASPHGESARPASVSDIQPQPTGD